MAKDSRKGDRLYEEFREPLAAANTFVETFRSTQTAAAVTFEDCLDALIRRVDGDGTAMRPSKLSKIETLRANVVTVTEKIKATKAEKFRSADTEDDVNTAVESLPRYDSSAG